MLAASAGGVAQERGDFVGNWFHANPATGGIVRIEIGERGEDLTAHACGACSPLCHWGEITVPFDAYPVIAVHEFGFKTTTLALCLAGSDHLVVGSDHVFHDGNGSRPCGSRTRSRHPLS